MSEPPPSLPVELWLMVIDHLRSEDSPQHISRLAQTCRWFHQEINHFLYQPAKFLKRENALQFASIIRRRPDLKALVMEVRHYADSGFHNFTFCSNPFYKELATLPNLQTLSMRPKHYSKRTTRLERWEDLMQETCTFINALDWEDEVMEDITKILNEDRGEEEGAPKDPFDLDLHLLRAHVPTDPDDLLDRARFCGGYLENSLPALRTCHIGDYGIPCQSAQPTVFNNSIMALSQLKSLCVTGATFNKTDYDYEDSDSLHSMPYLEELTLLNCDINASGLQDILKRTLTLKRLTLRGDNELGEFAGSRIHSELHGSLFLGQVFADFSGHSLESLDLDFYEGTTFGMSLNGLRCLKSLTVTPYSILRLDSELQGLVEFEAILPPSLETLILRHEEGEDLPLSHLFKSVKNRGLPNLRTVTVRIPDIIQAPDGLTGPLVLIEAESWVDKFKEFDVALEVVRTPYPMNPPKFLDTPKFDLCSCEVLEVFHRLKSEPLKTFFKPPPGRYQGSEYSSENSASSEEQQNSN